MKSIFLSMLAIAALASCTNENFTVDPPGTQGEKMLVDITLSNGEVTKAAGEGNNAADQTISNVTVFFLNATDQIVSRTYLSPGDLADDAGGAPGAKTATVETRTTATKIMVIANIGEDRTATGQPLSVSTRNQLVNVVQDLINTDQPPLPVQASGDVLMSGEGDVSAMAPDPAGGPSTATATVGLNYIAAKIRLSSIALGGQVQGEYGTDFTFKRAFLLNAQTKSHYFPTGDSYIPDPKAYANGVAWNPDWTGGDPGYPVVPDFNQDLNFPSMGQPQTNVAHWYVFENDPASVATTEHPTTLVVEIEWTKTKANPGEGIDEEKVMRMFNVIFAPGDKGVLKAGQAYNVALTFNGNFLPESDGGNGGGGDENPDQPNISANVGVTVTPADWTDANVPEKPFE